MTRILLGQLFDCTEQGGALVAEGPDGELRHIDDVPAGLKCSCVCPGCQRRMVARKGKIRAHGFAHHSDPEGQSCTSAGETALHKHAKAILDRELKIKLPELIIAKEGDQEVVVHTNILEFERAILETKDGSIVPDVVLELGGRRLIVEFKVTHACDETKIARIRSMNVGAIEIDLAGYRDLALEDLADDILYKAPRVWLHNPREADARHRLSERHRQREEDRKREIENFRRLYQHKHPSNVEGKGEFESLLRLEGLDQIINLPIDGAGCFVVPVAEWQAAIIHDLLSFVEKPFRTRNGVSGLKSRNWIDPNFRYVPDYVSTALKESELQFAPPMKAVEDYLREVARLGFLRAGRQETWYRTSTLVNSIEYAREVRERPIRRLAEMREIVTKQLNSLPEYEVRAFEFEDWANTVLPCRDYCVADAARYDEPEWSMLCREISGLQSKIRFSPRPGMDLFGLPFVGELQRSLDRKRNEAEQREIDRREKELAAENARIDHIKEMAFEVLDDQAQGWLDGPNSSLASSTPLAAARSEEGYGKAIEVLDKLRQNLEREEILRHRRDIAVANLEEQALSRYYDPDKARLWMRSSRPELGGKSPTEFTRDEKTAEICAQYLPTKRSHR
ncbi:hypothetical protein LAL4801_05746 [Roseibium aggregatum]|uniref:Antitoxin Xre/MbcA/ParS-like toxin-binding domain-containing protein n=2 Tax=Roseibium aggregatum TaxID=187304 RepID=A0A0M6YC50_9HYPH|nr:hypothetical protein LAL4801_05746 [Roseibium aggregatum]